jgi:hypothetical protein
VVVVVVLLLLPVDPVEWQTWTVPSALSASVRLVNTLPSPTTTVLLDVGRCSTIWQRLVLVSCTT